MTSQQRMEPLWEQVCNLLAIGKFGTCRHRLGRQCSVEGAGSTVKPSLANTVSSGQLDGAGLLHVCWLGHWQGRLEKWTAPVAEGEVPPAVRLEKHNGCISCRQRNR